MSITINGKSIIKMCQGHGDEVRIKTEVVQGFDFPSIEEFEFDQLPKQVVVTDTGSENVYFDYLSKSGYLRHGFSKIH